MASTTFIDGITRVIADWLNDVNSGIYNYIVGHNNPNRPVLTGNTGITDPSINVVSSQTVAGLDINLKGSLASPGAEFNIRDGSGARLFQVTPSDAMAQTSYLTVASSGAGQVALQVSSGNLNITSPSSNSRLTVNNLDVVMTGTGKGLRVSEGANAKQGSTTLVAGSRVVANTSVTATSRIFLTGQADGGTPGFLRVSSRIPGTSFTITSSNGADTSTVAYEIFEPA